MTIVTKTGDSGTTGLFGGVRISKANLRVEAYGTVDELNAQIGCAAALLRDLELQEKLREIQSDLLSAGADLSMPPDRLEKLAPKSVQVGPDRAARLEEWIHEWESQTAPLSQFILPGGSASAAALHVCRAVCRRAERCVVRLAETEQVNPEVIIYLNRLSDLFFVLARWVNAQAGVDDVVWAGRKK